MTPPFDKKEDSLGLIQKAEHTKEELFSFWKVQW